MMTHYDIHDDYENNQVYHNNLFLKIQKIQLQIQKLILNIHVKNMSLIFQS